MILSSQKVKVYACRWKSKGVAGSAGSIIPIAFNGEEHARAWPHLLNVAVGPVGSSSQRQDVLPQ